MKRFLKLISVYLTFALILGNVIAFTASYFLSKSYFYKPDFIVNHFEPESHFDYIIAGSSRGLTTVGTEEVDQELGTKGFNVSMDDTDLPSQILMIKHFFESDYSADFCILTLDLTDFENSGNNLNDNAYRYISFSRRPYVREYYQKYEKGIIRPLTLSNYLPVLAFAYYNLELFWTSGMAIIKPRYTNRFDLNGNYSYPQGDMDLDISQNETLNIPISIKNPLLKELRDYLDSKNCALIIYVAPYFGKDIEIKENGTYDVINHSAKLKSSSYFFDIDHVNNDGKQIATKLFSDAISVYF